MDIQEALALKERAREQAIRAREIAEARVGSDDDDDWVYIGADLPHENFWVVTTDGEDFGIMWFEGVYSGYSEIMAWSAEEWDKRTVDWRQEYFNPDGAWAHRRVVRHEPSDRGHTMVIFDCGHQEVGRPFPLVSEDYEIGARVKCFGCRSAGVGADHLATAAPQG